MQSGSPGSSKTKRAGKACGRCRRMRIKCVPNTLSAQTASSSSTASSPNGISEQVPCIACFKAGESRRCHFLPRGYAATDREYRSKPTKSSEHRQTETIRHTPSPTPQRTSVQSRESEAARSSLYDVLPPVEEIVEAVRRYTSSYFQIGFFHRVLFIERVRTDFKTISPFLLVSICAVAAPFTPCLVTRYESKENAQNYFMELIQNHLGRQMCTPSLEAAQAFLLLGIVEWGRGNGAQAWMFLGVAIRMCGFLGLHKELTYILPPRPTPDQIIDAEIARRTFWAVVCHECLLAGQSRPTQLVLSDIDALLPCDETDFSYGIIPMARAAFPGSAADIRTHDTQIQAPMSLYGSMVHAKFLWSLTARHASQASLDVTPGAHDETSHLLQVWNDFEARLPPRQQYSLANLRGMVAEGSELPFLTMTLLARLSRIVLRRLHISSIATHSMSSEPSHTMSQQMANAMLQDSEELLSRVEACLSLRPLELGFPPILLFGIYISGLVFSILLRWPNFCSSPTENSGVHYGRCVDILYRLSDAWPLAAEWHRSLIKAASVNHSGNIPTALTAAFSPTDCVQTEPSQSLNGVPSKGTSTARPPMLPTQHLTTPSNSVYRNEETVPQIFQPDRMNDPIFTMSRRGSGVSDWFIPEQQNTIDNGGMQEPPDIGLIFNDTFDTFNTELSQFLADNLGTGEFDELSFA